MDGSLTSNGNALATHLTHPARARASRSGRANDSLAHSRLSLRERLPTLVRIADFAGVAGVGFAIDTPFAWHDVRPVTHSLGIVLAAIALVNCLQILNAYSVSSLSRKNLQLANA